MASVSTLIHVDLVHSTTQQLQRISLLFDWPTCRVWKTETDRK